MGDIWPYGPPAHSDWRTAYDLMIGHGANRVIADILAAIGGAESRWDWRVINDTPATFDYSVGIWQINYYGDLSAARTAAFGTPRHLIASGPRGQAAAAWSIYQGQGLSAWSTFNSGAYQAFLHGQAPVPGQPNPGPVYTLPPPNEDDWSSTVRAAAASHVRLARSLTGYASAIRTIR